MVSNGIFTLETCTRAILSYCLIPNAILLNKFELKRETDYIFSRNQFYSTNCKLFLPLKVVGREPKRKKFVRFLSDRLIQI